jgi:hypothetical protein
MRLYEYSPQLQAKQWAGERGIEPLNKNYHQHKALERFLTICLGTSQLELQVFPAATYNELVDDPPTCLPFTPRQNNCPKKSAIVTFSPAPYSKFAQSFALSEQPDLIGDQQQFKLTR